MMFKCSLFVNSIAEPIVFIAHPSNHLCIISMNNLYPPEPLSASYQDHSNKAEENILRERLDKFLKFFDRMAYRFYDHCDSDGKINSRQKCLVSRAFTSSKKVNLLFPRLIWGTMVAISSYVGREILEGLSNLFLRFSRMRMNSKKAFC